MLDPAYGKLEALTPSDIRVERIFDANSTVLNQSPTGLGPANAIQLEFGPAQNGPGDPVMISATGEVTFNQAGLYRIKTSLQIGRSGASGISKVLIRVLGDGVQLGRTVPSTLPSSNVQTPFQDETWLNVPQGLVLTYEIMRDSSGSDFGGLIGQQVTTEPGSWNQDVCAQLRIERWVSK